MFNNFQAQKQEKEFKQLIKEQKMTIKWKNRYKNEVKPKLVQKFNLRMKGFMFKMQDNPYIIPKEPEIRQEKLLGRDYNPQKNIAPGKFNFQKTVDWKSAFPILHENHKTLNLKNLESEEFYSVRTFKSIFSQSKYRPQKQQFRSREKQKQINPAMRYSSKQSKISTAKKNQKIKTLPSLIKDLNHNSESIASDNEIASQERHSSIGDLSNSLHLLKDVRRKTQEELLQEEELKELAKDRLYFKSLSNYEQQSLDKSQKRVLKQILSKCGVQKRVNERYKQQQIDSFALFLKEAQKS